MLEHVQNRRKKNALPRHLWTNMKVLSAKFGGKTPLAPKGIISAGMFFCVEQLIPGSRQKSRLYEIILRSTAWKNSKDSPASFSFHFHHFVFPSLPRFPFSVENWKILCLKFGQLRKICEHHIPWQNDAGKNLPCREVKENGKYGEKILFFLKVPSSRILFILC